MNVKKFILLFLATFSLFFSNAQTTVIDSIMNGNSWRNYRLFIPSGYSFSKHLPLVFNFHGYGSNALEQQTYSGFDAIVDNAKAIVCYPNGLNNSWDVFGGAVNDIGYVDTLITLLHISYNIDLNRVYATGLSNGGFMSNLLGCQLADKFAAIAPVAGTNVTGIQTTCSPSRLMPVLYIHGTNDPVVAYTGTPTFVSVNDLMNLWASKNGCSSVTDTFLLPDISPNDSCRAQRITWHDCDSNKQVIHYRIINGGHTWPGASISIGVTNQDFIASRIIWDFFNQFSLNSGITDVTSQNPIQTFPNPFSSSINIEVPNPSRSTVKIFSPEGRLVRSSEQTERTFHLDLNSLPPGIYFLNIIQNDIPQTIRIVKIQ